MENQFFSQICYFAFSHIFSGWQPQIFCADSVENSLYKSFGAPTYSLQNFVRQKIDLGTMPDFVFKPSWLMIQSSYLSQISQIIFVEKKLVCGDILGNFGEILGNCGKFWEFFGDFATIYALSCGEKLSPKVHLWRKNDKYQVCAWPLCFIQHILDAVCVVVAIIWVLENIRHEASFHFRFVFLLKALLL